MRYKIKNINLENKRSRFFKRSVFVGGRRLRLGETIIVEKSVLDAIREFVAYPGEKWGVKHQILAVPIEDSLVPIPEQSTDGKTLDPTVENGPAIEKEPTTTLVDIEGDEDGIDLTETERHDHREPEPTTTVAETIEEPTTTLIEEIIPEYIEEKVELTDDEAGAFPGDDSMTSADPDLAAPTTTLVDEPSTKTKRAPKGSTGKGNNKPKTKKAK